MATIKHIFKGESLTILFTFPAEYDMARIQSHGIWIGRMEFTGVIIGQGIELKLTSLQTDLMSGNQRVSLWIDDTILGVRKPYVGDIAVGNTNALPDNDSTSEVYDVIVNVDISVTSIEAGDLMFNYVKGISAYQVWLDAGNTGTVEDYLADIKGDPFTYSDFTPEQIEALKVKGDAFEYSDFTPEQIALLQKPASDIATTVSSAEQLRVTSETNRNNAEGLRLSAEIIRNDNEADRIEAEELRASAETGRQTAEGLRVQAELNRQTNTSTAISNAEQATDDANDAALLANEKAGLANEKAGLANEKAGLAATATTQANDARDGANSAAQSATNLVNSYATDLAAKVAKTDIATQVEAEANTENTKFMTALRVFQNFVKNATTYVFSTLNTTSKTITGAINELKGQTPASMPLQTVANINQYYPIIENNVGAILGRHQTNYWKGSAWIADNSFGIGTNSLSSNTGNNSNGFGNSSLQNNTGNYLNGFGNSSLQNNTGNYANGFGASSLQNNTGSSCVGIGWIPMRNNTGNSCNAIGDQCLNNNTGSYCNSIGSANLRYNQKDNNTAIGHNSYSAFFANIAGNKTADSSAVDITLERITLTSHGFGAVNDIVNIKYASTDGTAIGGLSVGNIYQVKIIDANTVEFISGSQKINLTSQGIGNHTFTPQFAYTNTTCLGANTQPNKDNQVVLGSTSVDTVKMGGTARTIASATATGEKGEMCWDANYIYVCVATNTWKRIALSTW